MQDSLHVVNDSASQSAGPALGPSPVPEILFDGRTAFAASFLVGQGLEIGGLHLPLPVPPKASVRYVDRMPAAELRREYPELASFDLVEVDVIDNGETLETVDSESQDFIIANHFLEHCEDPIGTIGVHLNRLRPGGVLFYAVPDKRFTFDHNREVTPVEHMVEDHLSGPEKSRMGHYREWVKFVDPGSPDGGKLTDEQLEAEAARLERESYSIHMHVWSQAEFLQMILKARELHDEMFDIEAAAHRGIEFMVVLRKHGGTPRRSPNGGAFWQQSLPRALRRIGSRLPPSAKRRARRAVKGIRAKTA